MKKKPSSTAEKEKAKPSSERIGSILNLFKKVKTLKMENCHFLTYNTLAAFLKENSGLEELHWENCSFPGSVPDLKDICEFSLNLKKATLRSLTSNPVLLQSIIKGSPNLEELWVENNQLVQIPPHIKLKKLRLIRAQVMSLIPTLKTLPNLEDLYITIGNSNISSLGCAKLKNLYLEGSSIDNKELNDILETSTELESLSIDRCINVTELPLCPTKLKKLILNNCTQISHENRKAFLECNPQIEEFPPLRNMSS